MKVLVNLIDKDSEFIVDLGSWITCSSFIFYLFFLCLRMIRMLQLLEEFFVLDNYLNYPIPKDFIGSVSYPPSKLIFVSSMLISYNKFNSINVISNLNQRLLI